MQVFARLNHKICMILTLKRTKSHLGWRGGGIGGLPRAPLASPLGWWMNLSGREGARAWHTRDTPYLFRVSSRLNPSLTKIFAPCRESTCFPYSRAKQTKTNLINSPFREGTFFLGGGGGGLGPQRRGSYIEGHWKWAPKEEGHTSL